jgi:hypothetical protein
MAPLRINENEYSSSEVLEALNYGHSHIFQLSSAWDLHVNLTAREGNGAPRDIWNDSLIRDFIENIFDKRTSWLIHGHDRFGIYDNLDQQGKRSNDFYARLELMNLRLLRESFGQLSRCCKRACVNQKFYLPHSYLVTELIRLVRFLTNSMQEEIFDAEEGSMGFERFLDESALFWKYILRNYPVLKANKEIDKAEPSYIFDEPAWKRTAYDIFLNNLDFDLILGISRPQRERRISRSKSHLIPYLEMESKSGPVNYWRSAFLSHIGVTEAETRKGEIIQGPLDDLKAANLLAGPFRIALTKKPAEHLTFSGVHSRPVIRLLDLEQIFECYRPQRTGIAR